MANIGLTILYLAGAALVARLLHSLLKRPSAPLPPGPKPTPFIGHVTQIPEAKQWLHFHKLSKTYGPVMHFNMAGQSLVVVSSHRVAHDLLSKRGTRYSDRPRMVMAGELVTKGMHMLLRPYDERYRLHQRMGAPLLSVQAASLYRPVQELESRQLLWDVLRESGEVGEKGVDLRHHFERAMASTIYCLNYGYRLETGHETELLDAKKVQAAATQTIKPGNYIVDVLPWLNYLPRFLAPWKREAEQLFELEYSLHVGNLRRGLHNAGWNFSKQMKASKQAQDMPEAELAFDLGVLSDAALDTSRVSMEWFIIAWITSGANGWVAKAQELLDEVVGRDRLPTFEDRPKLAYIDAIVNETLRWRPVIGAGVPHFTKTEDVYEGMRIPANSIVLPNNFAICRDEVIYGDMSSSSLDDFDPDRWMASGLAPDDLAASGDPGGLNSAALSDVPQAYFGYGRRICTGRHIAKNTLFTQVARLLWAFEARAGVVDGKRHVVDTLGCADEFVTEPKAFRAEMKPRGAWVRDVVERSGSTLDEDHVAILDKARPVSS